MQRIPVLVISYNRPEFLKRRLVELTNLNNAQPIIVSLDYHSEEMNQRYNSVLNEFLSSNANLSVVRNKENLGIARHLPFAVGKVLKNHSHTIVIEDDIAIGLGAIRSFEEAREYLDANPEILTIGGFTYSPWFARKIIKNKWRSSKYFSAWGWMTSQERWPQINQTLKEEEIRIVFQGHKGLDKLSRNQQDKWLHRFHKCKVYEERTWDIPVQYWSFKHGKKHLLPTFRIVENEGFGNLNSTNTKLSRPRWMGKFKVQNTQIEMRVAGRIVSYLMEIVDSFSIASDRNLTKLNFLRKILRNDK